MADKEVLPEVLFDGMKVYAELTEKHKHRTSHENVSDVLGAVVKILRREGLGLERI